MFAKPHHPNPTPTPRTGTYGLAMPPMWGAAQRMLYPTQNTPLAHGPTTTNTYEYGTNLWPLPMYPASRQLTSRNQRSSPFMVPTANHPQYTLDNRISPGYSFLIPTEPPTPSSGQAPYSNNQGDDSPPNQTPRTPTPRPLTSSPSSRSEDNQALMDLTHFGRITMPDPEYPGIHFIPTTSTTTGQSLTPSTKKSSDQNEPLPGTSGGRTSNNASNTEALAFGNLWTSSSLPRGEIQSTPEVANR